MRALRSLWNEPDAHHNDGGYRDGRQWATERQSTAVQGLAHLVLVDSSQGRLETAVAGANSTDRA
jgi:hypothetical protein